MHSLGKLVLPNLLNCWFFKNGLKKYSKLALGWGSRVQRSNSYTMYYAFKLHCPHAPDDNGLLTLNYDHLACHQIIAEPYCTELWTLQYHYYY
jgi:hypothetical protein